MYLAGAAGGDVATYDPADRSSPQPFTRAYGPMAAGPSTAVVYIDRASRVVLSPSRGKSFQTISAPPAMSVALLRSEDVVVAAPTPKGFLHVYSPSGTHVRTFGAYDNTVADHTSEVAFLHRGKVLVDPFDRIYYVYYYLPLVQQFSNTGTLLRTFRVTGAAADMQAALAARFMQNKAPNLVGGVSVMTSATVDFRTGHVWIGLNGGTNAPPVYEYDGDGRKVAEYALALTTSAGPQPITAVADLAAAAGALYVLTPTHQVIRFDRPPASEPDA